MKKQREKYIRFSCFWRISKCQQWKIATRTKKGFDKMVKGHLEVQLKLEYLILVDPKIASYYGRKKTCN